MNAPTRVEPPRDLALTTAIVQNLDLLRALAAGDRWSTKKAMAEAFTGGDQPNLNKKLQRLHEDGALFNAPIVGEIALTSFGEQVLKGVAVIEGKVVLPDGHAMVRWRNIVPNPDNARKDFTSEAAIRDADALRISILERGVIHALQVYPPTGDGQYMLHTGERRWRAVGTAIDDGDLDEDFEFLVRVQDLDQEDAFVLAMDENLQRRNLSYTEEARAYDRLITDHKWSKEKVAERFKRSPKHVSDYLRLLTIPPEALAQLEAGEITYRQARALFQEHKPEPALFGDGGLPKAKAGEAKAEPKPAPEPEDPKGLELTPKLALIVAELADKAGRGTPPGMEPGYTAVTDIPTDGATAELIRRGIVSFRSQGPFGAGPGPFGRVMIHSSGAAQWLEANGFYDGATQRGALLSSLRVEVVGEAKALAAWKADRYATEWLNLATPADEADLPVEEEEDDELAEDDKVPADFAGQVRHVAEQARREASEPGSSGGDAPSSVVNQAVLDAKAIAELARDVSGRMAEWRHAGMILEGSWDDRAHALADALAGGSVIDVVSILARERLAQGAMSVSSFMGDALRLLIKAGA